MALGHTGRCGASRLVTAPTCAGRVAHPGLCGQKLHAWTRLDLTLCTSFCGYSTVSFIMSFITNWEGREWGSRGVAARPHWPGGRITASVLWLYFDLSGSRIEKSLMTQCTDRTHFIPYAKTRPPSPIKPRCYRMYFRLFPSQ